MLNELVEFWDEHQKIQYTKNESEDMQTPPTITFLFPSLLDRYPHYPIRSTQPSPPQFPPPFEIYAAPLAGSLHHLGLSNKYSRDTQQNAPPTAAPASLSKLESTSEQPDFPRLLRPSVNPDPPSIWLPSVNPDPPSIRLPSVNPDPPSIRPPSANQNPIDPPNPSQLESPFKKYIDCPSVPGGEESGEPYTIRMEPTQPEIHHSLMLNLSPLLYSSRREERLHPNCERHNAMYLAKNNAWNDPLRHFKDDSVFNNTDSMIINPDPANEIPISKPRLRIINHPLSYKAQRKQSAFGSLVFPRQVKASALHANRLSVVPAAMAQSACSYTEKEKELIREKPALEKAANEKKVADLEDARMHVSIRSGLIAGANLPPSKQASGLVQV